MLRCRSSSFPSSFPWSNNTIVSSHSPLDHPLSTHEILGAVDVSTIDQERFSTIPEMGELLEVRRGDELCARRRGTP